MILKGFLLLYGDKSQKSLIMKYDVTWKKRGI